MNNNNPEDYFFFTTVFADVRSRRERPGQTAFSRGPAAEIDA
jgi:hypothetical protein